MKINEILKALKENTLKKLDFSDIEAFSKENLIEVAEKLMANSSVTEVVLRDLKIEPKEMMELVDAIRIHKTVAILHLEKVSLDLDSIKIFNEIFKVNTSIRDLRIINCNFSGERLKVLADCIKYLSARRGRIRNLELDGNSIGDNDLENIVEILTINHYLCTLSLKNNKITDKGVQYLADVLAYKEPGHAYFGVAFLTELDLTNNLLTQDAIVQLEPVIARNPVLTNFEFGQKNIPNSDKLEISLKNIEQHLERNHKNRARFLDLDHDFSKLNIKLDGENRAEIYQKHKDSSKWVVKSTTTYIFSEERVAVLAEVYAAQFMRYFIPYYPVVEPINTGGSFMIGYRFVDNIFTSKNLSDSTTKPIVNLELSYVLSVWLGDPDMKKNVFCTDEKEQINLYKLDLGQAFSFPHNESNASNFPQDRICIENFLPKAICSEMSVKPAQIRNKEIIDSIKKIIQLKSEELLQIGAEYREMMGMHGGTVLERLQERQEAFRKILPGLEEKLGMSNQITISPFLSTPNIAMFSTVTPNQTVNLNPNISSTANSANAIHLQELKPH